MAAGRTESIRFKVKEVEQKQRYKLNGIITNEGDLKKVLVDANRNELDHSKIQELIASLNTLKATNDDIRQRVDYMDFELNKTIQLLERTLNNGVEVDAASELRLDELKIDISPVQEEGQCASRELDELSVEEEDEIEEVEEDKEKLNVERVKAGRKVRTSADSGIALSTGSSILSLSLPQRDSTAIDDDTDQSDPECEMQDGAATGETSPNDLNKETGTGIDNNSIDDNMSMPRSKDPTRSSAVFYKQLGTEEQDFFLTQAKQLDHQRGQRGRRPSQGDITLPPDRSPTNDK